MTVGEPRRVGAYEIRDALGQGGMASVFKAYQPSLDRIVAMKVISAHLAAEPEFLERFRQEALAIARLAHPNIVVVHDFGTDNGVPYLVMEFIDGKTLADLLDDGAGDHLVELVSQIAAGLDYAHSRGIVHRDIKPQNVLVTREGRAVLADFGLARMMEGAQRLTMSGGIVGTPEYMSPEQAAGRQTDHRTDIYALGVILFEMATGQRPFTSETPLGVLMKHLQEEPPPARKINPQVPEAVEAVIKKSLAKKPEDRYQTAGELARALRDAVAGGAPSPGASASAAVPEAPVPAPAAPAPGETAIPTSGVQPPQLDLSKYAGLRASAEKAAKPHQTPSLAQHAAAAAPEAAPAPPPRPTTRTCPSCSATIPPDVSICPECFFMLPFDDVATQPQKPQVERKQVRVNLIPFGLRWEPAGFDRARSIAQAAAAKLQREEGWELVVPLDASGVLVQGRSASGATISGAVLTLQRMAS